MSPADTAKAATAKKAAKPEKPAPSDDAGDKDAKDEGQQGKPKSGRLKLIIIAVVILLVVAGGGVGGAYFLGYIGGDKEAAHAEKKVPEETGPPVYVDFPEMVVDLKATGPRTRFVKLEITVELAGEQSKLRLEAVKPRVTSGFQTFLRDMTAQDLAGRAGTDKVRAAFLEVVNGALGPDYKAHDILFRSILVQ